MVLLLVCLMSLSIRHLFAHVSLVVAEAVLQERLSTRAVIVTLLKAELVFGSCRWSQSGGLSVFVSAFHNTDLARDVAMTTYTETGPENSELCCR